MPSRGWSQISCGRSLLLATELCGSGLSVAEFCGELGIVLKRSCPLLPARPPQSGPVPLPRIPRGQFGLVLTQGVKPFVGRRELFLRFRVVKELGRGEILTSRRMGVGGFGLVLAKDAVSSMESVFSRLIPKAVYGPV